MRGGVGVEEQNSGVGGEWKGDEWNGRGGVGWE